MLLFAFLIAMFPKKLSKTKMNKVGVEQAEDTDSQADEIIPSPKKMDKEEEAARTGVVVNNDTKQHDKFQLVDTEKDHAPTMKGKR